MFHASLPTSPPDIDSLICSTAANQLMQEYHFSAILHQFSDLQRRSRLKSGRVQIKSDAWTLVFPSHASTPVPGLMHEHPIFCSMHHFSIIIIPRGKELTTDPPFPAVCRQSNFSSKYFFEFKFFSGRKITSSGLNFLLPRLYPAFLPRI